MNIFIAGGGRVGFHLARLLSLENHDVTVIEQDPARAEVVDYTLDVRVVEGNAVSIMLLNECGVLSADLFISVTGGDEVNLIAAATAKGLGVKQVVARAEEPLYFESNILYESSLGIDFVLSPEALTAVNIATYIQSPGIVAAETFGRGLVQMRQMRVTASPTRGGKTLEDVCPPGTGVLLGAISRKGEIMIPHGDTIVEAGAVVTLVGHPEGMTAILKLFQGREQSPEKVVIMGGSVIGVHLALVLENSACSVKLFDRDPARCEVIAAKLKRTKVVCRDATARVALEQEHVDDADVFVATTNDDEHNIMASVLAKEVGAAQTIAVVHQPDFAPLVAKLGVDHAVTPRACIANRILRLVHRDRVSSLAVLEEGQVQVLEFTVKESAPVTGASLREVQPRFPRGALVATIVRAGHVIVPSGEDTIQAEDSVIVIATPDSIEALRKLFQR